MVSVLVLDGVFDVRPLLLRWDAGLLSGDGGFNWVGAYNVFRSSIVGVKCEGECMTVVAAERERRTGSRGVDGFLTAVATDSERRNVLPRRAFVSPFTDDALDALLDGTCCVGGDGSTRVSYCCVGGDGSICASSCLVIAG